MRTGQRTKLAELSVFFPCYNEEGNISVLLKQAVELIPQLAEKFEIIVVNDGSTDATSKIAHDFEKKYSFIRVIDQENKGYGGAVNTGFKACKYEWVFFTDSDLQFELKELNSFVKRALSGKEDLIIGYRKKRAEGFTRFALALGMKVWNHVWLGFPFFIKDIDCAFKLIRKDVLVRVGDLESSGNLVSSELLLKAHKIGFSFHQIGVNHFNRKAGVSNCGGVKDVSKVVKETFMLRTALNQGRTTVLKTDPIVLTGVK